MLRETRRILLDGNIVDVVRRDDELVAGDGRTVGVDEAVHLPPTVPSKIICVHLNYSSRVAEMMVSLPPARRIFTSRCLRSTHTSPRSSDLLAASG